MRFIELLIATTALIVAVKAAPTIEKREMINVEEPFDAKAFVFNPRKLKHTTGKRRRGRLNKRTYGKGCCGNFGLDLNTNLKIGTSGMEDSEPVPAPPAPAAVAPAPLSPPAPPASNDHDTIIVNVDNKINH
ncbi:hypothetical protein BDF21DRAFT_419228 [Thamnidium elegans]|uniref:Uncharacterized protein n=1 Tax=Thamnidium elegans TaxID=101142 RepID=A0A8H7T0N6_9FUNG|nr:hypothetical protein INT48_009640 [Thamnidium elegans]KAI8080548.1 hypothetical protein BDF21DRAFT_419228 [Thamnidium elegans]